MAATGKSDKTEKDGVVPFVMITPPKGCAFEKELLVQKEKVFNYNFIGYVKSAVRQGSHITMAYNKNMTQQTYERLTLMITAAGLNWSNARIKDVVRTREPIKFPVKKGHPTFPVMARIDWPEADALYIKLKEVDPDLSNQFEEPDVPGGPKAFRIHITLWYLEAESATTPPLSNDAKDVVLWKCTSPTVSGVPATGSAPSVVVAASSVAAAAVSSAAAEAAYSAAAAAAAFSAATAISQESAKSPETPFPETLRAELETARAETKDAEEREKMIHGIASFDAAIKTIEAELTAARPANATTWDGVPADVAAKAREETEKTFCRVYAGKDSRWGNSVKNLCLVHLVTKGWLTTLHVSEYLAVLGAS